MRRQQQWQARRTRTGRSRSTAASANSHPRRLRRLTSCTRARAGHGSEATAVCRGLGHRHRLSCRTACLSTERRQEAGARVPDADAGAAAPAAVGAAAPAGTPSSGAAVRAPQPGSPGPRTLRRTRRDRTRRTTSSASWIHSRHCRAASSTWQWRRTPGQRQGQDWRLSLAERRVAQPLERRARLVARALGAGRIRTWPCGVCGWGSVRRAT
jgi:hypothetical protein